MNKFFVTSGIWLSACILSAHNLSVFFSSALVLACAATGAAETVTGTLSFCYLLFIWKCFASVCVCWLAVHSSLFICAYLHDWLVMLVFSFQDGGESDGLTMLFLFWILKSIISPHIKADFQFLFKPLGRHFSLSVINGLFAEFYNARRCTLSILIIPAAKIGNNHLS